MSEIKPCFRKKDWNWKKGDNIISSIGGNEFYRNYMDCGEYFWDGEFNVVKFPKGMSLYHGSANLANAVVEYPLGKNFYEAVEFGTVKPQINPRLAVKNDDISYQLTKDIPIQNSYFANISTAKTYSKLGMDRKCKDNCIFAYKLKKNAVFLLMDDSYNIAKIFESPKVPTEIKEALMKMFSISDPNPLRSRSEHPFKRLSYNKSRRSERSWDLPFSQWMCNNVLTYFGYAGMAAPIQYINDKKHFHLEFIFCNAAQYLERDLSSKYDWQKESDIPIPEEIEKLLKTYKRFKSININTHAGNLYEHTVWTLLFYEFFIDTLDISPIYKVIGAISSLIHDIGKMSVTEELNKRIFVTTNSNFVYYSVPEHPKYGFEMLLQNIPLYMWDEEFTDLSNPTFKELIDLQRIVFEALEISKTSTDEFDKFFYMIFFLVFYHWDFGDKVVRKYNENPKNFNQIVLEFTEEKWEEYQKILGDYSNLNEFVNVLRVLIWMSAADVAGFLPFGKNRIREGVIQNARSNYFPFIENVPQKYRGSKLFISSNFENITKQADNIIKNLPS